MFRNEHKFKINQAQTLALSHRLSKLFLHDRFSKENGEYKISSIYFDTSDDEALREKIDGVRYREKFRVRYYNDDLTFIRLEKKSKINQKSQKENAVLSKEDLQNILQNNMDFLLYRKEKVCRDFYLKYRRKLLKPKSLVIYDREAFLFTPGNVRITLDKNIRTFQSDLQEVLNCGRENDIFEKKVETVFNILEVKYDQFIPDIVKTVLQGYADMQTAYSKYAVSRILE